MIFMAPWRFILALVLVLVLAQLSPAAIKKGPYLIYPGTNTQMMVLWQLDASTSCSLEWGLDAHYQSGRVTGAEMNSDHQYKQLIDGLTPGTKYFYRVAEGANLYPGSFQAAPPDDARSLKFLVYGDTRTDVNADNSVCGAMQATCTADPAYQTFTLHVGDWVGEDSEAGWSNEFFIRAANAHGIMTLLANLPFQGCIGNHEVNGVYYRKYWPYPYIKDPRFYWSFDYGPAHFTVVDQYDGANGISDGQLSWIKNDLATTRKPWKFFLYHEPAWTAANQFHGNNVRAQTALQLLCKEYGIELCFNGHIHLYARCTQDGVQHLTLGGGGATLYDPNPTQPGYVVKVLKTFHYAKVAINDNVLNFEAVEPDGTVIDRFTVTHPLPNNVRQRWFSLD